MPDENELHDGITADAPLVVGTKATRTYYFLYYILWVIEIFLAFRFVLKILAANPANVFAELIYGVSFVLMLPFQGIFPHKAPVSDAVHMDLDLSILFAMIVYAVIIWGISKFIIIKMSKSGRGVKVLK